MTETERFQKAEEVKEILLALDACYDSEFWEIHDCVRRLCFLLKQSTDERFIKEVPWAQHMRDSNLLTFIARNLSPADLQRMAPKINLVSIFFQMTCGTPPVKS